MSESQALFSLRHLRMVYPGTVALEDVSLDFRAGSVHALLGKNGAGKSTLVKILSGVISPTSGQLFMNGDETTFNSPRDAQNRGVATVHQELSLVPGLTVAENVLFTHLPRRRGLLGLGQWIVDWPSTIWRAQSLLKELEIDLDVRTPVRHLGTAEQQVVEIAKAMNAEPRVLLLDEPTSALSDREAQNLFRLIRRLQARGVAIVYISHRLQELREIVDTVSVLRDGRCAGTRAMSEATPRWISEMMFGNTVPPSRPPSPNQQRSAVLQVKNLSRAGEFQNVSFTVAAGEVLGIAGAVGAGRTELLMSIFGATPPDSGSVFIADQRVTRPSPQRMKSLGVALTPEDRKHMALVQMHSVRENLSLASLNHMATWGVIRRTRESKMVQQRVSELHIAISDPEQPVNSLSGGNQQKVVIGNWLNVRPRVMLLDEPTRGIDIQAKQQIFQMIRDLSADGIATVFVSSELEELLDVCHRIIVLRRGQLVGELMPDQYELGRLLSLCMED